MGIPGFYREIIKRYTNIQSYELDKIIDYFFIDFNGLIYDAERLIHDKAENTVKFENLLINEILKLVKDLIVNVVKPSKCVYISIDGPAPRAKMVQQRSRRYKQTVFEPFIKEQIQKSYGIEPTTSEWNMSVNASPGTKFMLKLSNALKQKITKKYFGKDLKFILSDAFCPGEGEHKFLNYIRNLDEDEGTSYCLYGKDADLLVLSMTVKKPNVYVCRPNDNYENKDLYKYEYLRVDAMKENFYNEIMDGFSKPYPENMTIDNIINDTTFIDSIVGNDFVKAPIYLKLTQESLSLIIGTYKQILHSDKELLVSGINNNGNNNGKIMINHKFLTKIFQELSIQEGQLMKKFYFTKVKKSLDGKMNHSKEKNYDSEYEYIINTYQHMPLCDPKNPLFKMYGDEFKKIDYSKPAHVWKKQYYAYYFNIDVNNPEVYNSERTKICIHYLESLMFTLFYYHNEPPSWTWFYQYRVAPCLSDVFTTLNKFYKNINKIKFNKGEPYTPFQQLMLILSPQSSYILPKQFGEIMTTIPYVQYYPNMIQIDATAGFKYIYSEALLPEIDEEELLPVIKKLEKKLNKTDTLRNTIQYEPYLF